MRPPALSGVSGQFFQGCNPVVPDARARGTVAAARLRGVSVRLVAGYLGWWRRHRALCTLTLRKSKVWRLAGRFRPGANRRFRSAGVGRQRLAEMIVVGTSAIVATAFELVAPGVAEMDAAYSAFVAFGKGDDFTQTDVVSALSSSLARAPAAKN